MKHHQDTFAHDNLPPDELQANYILDQPEFELPEFLNCVDRLLDSHIREGRGEHIAIRTFDLTYTYNDLFEKANKIAHVLKSDLNLVSGNRVLLRSANNPMMLATK